MKVYYNPELKKFANDLRNRMTFAEKIVWRALKNKQMLGFDFHRQKPVGNFIADYYCYDLRLIIEIDGVSHEDENVRIKDEIKNEYFINIGFNVLRFTDDEVIGNWDMVAERIIEFISTHPPAPSC